MDNSNDPNLPNSAPPVPGAIPTPPADPLIPSVPLSTPSWPSEQPVATPLNPTPSWPSAAPVQPVQSDPLAPTSPWSPPQPLPQQQQPLVQPQPFDIPQPTSTFTIPTVPETPAAATSPLDNPWGVPTQAPSIDATPEASVNQTPTQPSWMASSAPIEKTPTENAPTDLSQLIAGSGAAPAEPNTQASVAPETLVVSESNAEAPQVPTLPTEEHKGIPKWLIGVGIALLLVVIGASAYFILGIGQPQKATTSVPAVTTLTAVKTPAPIATQVPQATQPPQATSSASFGQIGGSSGTPQATSAADLIRQRQQQGR